jgi:hypothetical protein
MMQLRPRAGVAEPDPLPRPRMEPSARKILNGKTEA